MSQNNTYKALALGAVLGFLVSVVPSCGSSGGATCGPSNCSTGCCNAGKCVTGTNGNNTTCGTAGLSCVDCTKTTGSSCTSAFKCSGTGGGAGGGAGGGTGGAGGGAASCAQSCNGCCDSTGACQTGTAGTACGTGGATCASCASPATCVGNVCKDTSCTKCTKNGTCQTALSDTACGNGGISCLDCAATGATCNTATGVCTGGSCGTGCRDLSGACQTGNTKGACGTSGTCSVCTGSQVCSNGACVSGAGGGAGGGGGGAGGGSGGTCPGGAPCPSGCCSGGTCIATTFQSPTNCGTGAAACASCPANNLCSAGVCTSGSGGGAGNDGGPTGKIGSTCNTVADCNMLEGSPTPGVPSGQTGAICKKTQVPGGATYPNGICTKRCQADAECGANAACQYGLGFTGEIENLCMPRCNATTGPCREGFNCLNFGTTASPDPICLLAARDGGVFDPYDAGPGAGPGVSGGPCTTEAQCRPPDLGFCDPEFLPDGGLTGIPGGQCGADCSAGGSGFCGDGGTCVLFLFNTGDNLGQFIGGLCTAKCVANADGGNDGCRTGFGCEPLGAGATGPGYCSARCDNAGGGCGTGSTCNTVTGLCQ